MSNCTGCDVIQNNWRRFTTAFWKIDINIGGRSNQNECKSVFSIILVGMSSRFSKDGQEVSTLSTCTPQQTQPTLSNDVGNVV